MNPSIFNELTPMKALDVSSFPKAEVDVSLIIPARNASQTLESTVTEAHQFLSHHFKNSFEIILVPNPSPGDRKDQSHAVAVDLAKKLSNIKICFHEFPPGKGAAIRTGFQASQGRFIFFTDSDLPYDLEFFLQADQKLRAGYDLVTGNRRLQNSHFHIPVSLLPLAFGRHRLGLAFNRLVRLLLPIQTTDTQAGIKAFSRRLGIEAFSRLSCPGFLFDLEIFLTAAGMGYKQTDLPVTLHLNSEKSTVRILRECLLVGNWLSRIFWKNKKNHYGSAKKNPGILERYQNASFFTRFFLFARWSLTPYARMASRLPPQGPILDLGCGHGLLALTAALDSPARTVLGIDHDQERIGLAQIAARNLPNLEVKKGNLMDPPSSTPPYSGITMIDIMHYFEPRLQENLLRRAHQLLGNGGTLLVREVDPEGGWVSKWNRTYEKIATRIGFTQAEAAGLHFRTKKDWISLLESVGFEVKSERCSSFLFADILYTCERH